MTDLIITVADLKEVLKDIKTLTILEYKEYLYSFECAGWEGKLTLTGIKRVILSIWNNGCNEIGQDITFSYEGVKSFEFYMYMVEKYSKKQMPVLFINGVKY